MLETSVVPIALFLAMYQCLIILHSRQPIFQSDTDYYKHTINLTQIYCIGSIMSRMYKKYLMLISQYCSLRIYQYRLSQNSPIICYFRLPIRLSMQHYWKPPSQAISGHCPPQRALYLILPSAEHTLQFPLILPCKVIYYFLLLFSTYIPHVLQSK